MDIKFAFRSFELMVIIKTKLDSKTAVQEEGSSSTVKFCLETTQHCCCIDAAGRNGCSDFSSGFSFAVVRGEKNDTKKN